MLLLMALFCYQSSLQAQIVVSPSDFSESYVDQDISTDWADYKFHSEISNTTGDDIEINWVVKTSECPSAWRFFIADKDFSYTADVSSSPFPMPLSPNDTSAFYDLHLLPTQVPGCCNFLVEFTNDDDPNTIIATIEYRVDINEMDCFVSNANLNNGHDEEINIHPNPTTNSLSIDGPKSYDQLVIHNNIGQRVAILSGQQNRMNIEEWTSGLYHFTFFTNGEYLGHEQVIKQ